MGGRCGPPAAHHLPPTHRDPPAEDGEAESGADQAAAVVVMAPLRLSFEIRCSVEHAFEVWTTRFARLVAERALGVGES